MSATAPGETLTDRANRLDEDMGALVRRAQKILRKAVQVGEPPAEKSEGVTPKAHMVFALQSAQERVDALAGILASIDEAL